MRLLSRIVLTAVFMVLPMAAFAMTETVWDFRGGELPGEWKYAGIDEPKATPEGLRLTASARDGNAISAVTLPHPVEVVSLTFLNAAPTEAMLLWRLPGQTEGEMVELPFTIAADSTEQRIDINVGAYPQWNKHMEMIGLTLPKGADVLLRDMHFTHWNLLERSTEAIRSFWIFDQFSPLNINFVWGPVITFNPVGTRELFHTDPPPHGRSGMWVLYGILLLIAAALLIGRVRRPLTLFLLSFAALWLVFDLRMGMEMLSYVKHDYESYLSQPPGSKTFRTYLAFNDMVGQTQLHVHDVTPVALLTTRNTPVGAMLRYFLLPSPVIQPTGPRDDLPFWFILRRNDVDVDAQGRLTVNGVPWSKPGKVLKVFEPGSFLFQTTE